MSELRVIPVTFGGEHTTVTECRIRHDWGQVYKFLDIDLPDVFEARFSNAPTGASVPQIGKDNMVEIPAQFFESGAPIYCYITLHDEETDGRTVYTVKTPISPSSDRTDAEPEPEEESIITQAITALNSAVTTTSQKASEAAASADRAEQAAEGVEGYVERAESAQQAAESARDRTIEAETSARTSAATATEKASEAISSATTASQSALTAENASENASASADASYQNAQTAYRYAQDSATSAGQAESYASGASGYASDAQTHSQTASQKALEAAQSASQALTYKTDAESAKTASQTAQTASESARDGAVTAKADAESARDEAQEIANGISGKVEQIDSNTDRIESIEDDRYKPYPTDTASGSIASFPDGADDIPLKSCIVQIEPVQAGDGDPSPENERPISGWTGCEIKHSGEDTSNPTTYPITFPSSAGTVYGGYIDPINGELVVDRAIVDLGTLSWRYNQASLGGFDTSAIASVVAGGNNAICSIYPNLNKQMTTGNITANDGFFRINKRADGTAESGNFWVGVVFIKDTRYIDASAFKTAMSGVQLVYELAEPIHYPLTSNQINSLYGQNNLWADTGDTEVEYRADTKLYIEKLTQPEEYDMIADSAINSGQFFMVGNSLYRALANIASGATITVGTNAQRVSLSDALNLVNA